MTRSGSCGGGTCSWSGTATGLNGYSYSRSGSATRPGYAATPYAYRYTAPLYVYGYPRYVVAPYGYASTGTVVLNGYGSATVTRTVTSPHGNSISRSTTIYR